MRRVIWSVFVILCAVVIATAQKSTVIENQSKAKPPEELKHADTSSYNFGLRRITSESSADSIYLYRGWNLIGSPNPAVSSATITSISGITPPVYGYNTVMRTYEIADTLLPIRGYWVLSALDTTHYISNESSTDSVNLSFGWNLIGSPNPAVSAATLTSISGITPPVYGYNTVMRTYEITDTLFPLRGYWVLSTVDTIYHFSYILSLRTTEDTEICEGEPLTLTAIAESGIPPYQYDWTMTAQMIWDDEAEITVSTSETRIYRVRVRDSLGILFQTLYLYLFYLCRKHHLLPQTPQ
jgi:hypothetical protein